MKVFELMELLSKCQAGAEVVVGVNHTLNCCADSFSDDGETVEIRADKSRVEVALANGDTIALSEMVDEYE